MYTIKVKEQLELQPVVIDTFKIEDVTEADHTYQRLCLEEADRLVGIPGTAIVSMYSSRAIIAQFKLSNKQFI